jgi:hypothetical protein
MDEQQVLLTDFLFKFTAKEKIYSKSGMLFADNNTIEVLAIPNNYMWKARNVQTGYITMISPQHNVEVLLYKAKLRYDNLSDHVPGLDTLEHIVLHDQSIALIETLKLQSVTNQRLCGIYSVLLIMCVIAMSLTTWFAIKLM